MLPEFPKQVAIREKRLYRWFHEEMKTGGVVSGNLPIHKIEEGNRANIINSLGDESQIEMKKISSNEMAMDWSDLHSMDDEELKSQLKSAAHELGGSREKLLFESLSTTLQKYGQSKDAKGASFSEDMYLDLLRSVDIDFDEFGRPLLPTLYIGSKELCESVQKKSDEWRKSSSFQRKYQELMISKRKQHYVREACRKLVM